MLCTVFGSTWSDKDLSESNKENNKMKKRTLKYQAENARTAPVNGQFAY